MNGKVFFVFAVQLWMLFGLLPMFGPVPAHEKSAEPTILCKDGNVFVPCPKDLGDVGGATMPSVQQPDSHTLEDLTSTGLEQYVGKNRNNDGGDNVDENSRAENEDAQHTVNHEVKEIGGKKSLDQQFKLKGNDVKRSYITDYSDVNAIAAGALLDLLKETENLRRTPTALTSKFMRSRISAFRKYLKVSSNLKDNWNVHFGTVKQRGILISAGRAGAILNSFVVVHTIRHAVKSKLPIVIAHYGEEEFKAITRKFFEDSFSDIEFIDLEKEDYPEHHVCVIIFCLINLSRHDTELKFPPFPRSQNLMMGTIDANLDIKSKYTRCIKHHSERYVFNI